MSDDPQLPASADDVTRLLRASADGETAARDRLLSLVYRDLHAMARSRMHGERAGHTLGPTALVGEAYMRLFREHAAGDGADGVRRPAPWADRGAFFAAAATTMRRVLVDHARGRLAAKRGGGDAGTAGARWQRVPLDALEAARAVDPARLLELDEAMEALEAVDPRAAEVVRLRFFAGLEMSEIAELTGVSERTCKRDWAFARAWLHTALGIDEDEDADGDEPPAEPATPEPRP
jgi:RNA polymerase sigma factor (TIGR02999 family)